MNRTVGLKNGRNVCNKSNKSYLGKVMKNDDINGNFNFEGNFVQNLVNIRYKLDRI